MKRILSMTIALALVLSLATTAFATEGGEQPQEVSTIEDLQAAVTAAEDGDTIAVSAEITLDGVALETDKDITITRADTYESGALFRMKNGAVLSGFTIENNKYSATITCEASPEAKIEINNCKFVGDSENTKSFVDFFSGLSSIVASINNCSFDGAMDSAVFSKTRVQLTIIDSTFSHMLMDYINKRVKELDAQINVYRQQISELSPLQNAEKIDTKELKNYMDHWDELTFDDKRNVVDQLIVVIKATMDSCEITWKF